jgi:hypothetical protein
MENKQDSFDYSGSSLMPPGLSIRMPIQVSLNCLHAAALPHLFRCSDISRRDSYIGRFPSRPFAETLLLSMPVTHTQRETSLHPTGAKVIKE